MNPLTKALAEAHIHDLRQQACVARLGGAARKARRQRRAVTPRHRTFTDHVLPVTPGLFRYL
ncbi:MAG: hypothetical protein QOJ03_2425 [Frankiaceae bacterium]|jgi:hypothetical protein|nr:hypothetical protein [Frankiaceae bacterium]